MRSEVGCGGSLGDELRSYGEGGRAEERKRKGHGCCLTEMDSTKPGRRVRGSKHLGTWVRHTGSTSMLWFFPHQS